MRALQSLTLTTLATARHQAAASNAIFRAHRMARCVDAEERILGWRGKKIEPSLRRTHASATREAKPNEKDETSRASTSTPTVFKQPVRGRTPANTRVLHLYGRLRLPVSTCTPGALCRYARARSL